LTFQNLATGVEPLFTMDCQYNAVTLCRRMVNWVTRGC